MPTVTWLDILNKFYRIPWDESRLGKKLRLDLTHILRENVDCGRYDTLAKPMDEKESQVAGS